MSIHNPDTGIEQRLLAEVPAELLRRTNNRDHEAWRAQALETWFVDRGARPSFLGLEQERARRGLANPTAPNVERARRQKNRITHQTGARP